MKKLTVITILLTSLLLLQTGCVSRPSPKSVSREPLAEAGSSQDTAPSSGEIPSVGTPITPESAVPSPITHSPEEGGGFSRDLDDMKARLAGYSNDLEELAATGSYMILHGQQYSGVQAWESFYGDVQDGTPAELVLIQFTVEGDAILHYLNYDGRDFYMVKDYTRDAFAEDGEKYSEGTYPYLKVFDSTSENGDLERRILLTEDEGLTAQEYQKLSGSETQGEFRTAFLTGFFLGNENAVLTGQESWHDIGTVFDESTILIPEENIAKIEIQNGTVGGVLTLEDSDAFKSVISRYAALDIQPDQSMESRSGYAYMLRLYDSEGNLLQSVIPYKDGVQIQGTFYNGSMNGTSTQLLQKLKEIWQLLKQLCGNMQLS